MVFAHRFSNRLVSRFIASKGIVERLSRVNDMATELLKMRVFKDL